MLQTLLDKASKWSHDANMFGISVPLIKDPKSGKGSVSLTLVFISSLIVILGLIGKWSGKLGTVDINNALAFFYASAGLYFGRNLKGSDKASPPTAAAAVDADPQDPPSGR